MMIILIIIINIVIINFYSYPINVYGMRLPHTVLYIHILVAVCIVFVVFSCICVVYCPLLLVFVCCTVPLIGNLALNSTC